MFSTATEITEAADSSFNMNMVMNKRVTTLILSKLFCHYLCNHSTLDIRMYGYIDVT